VFGHPCTTKAPVNSVIDHLKGNVGAILDALGARCGGFHTDAESSPFDSTEASRLKLHTPKYSRSRGIPDFQTLSFTMNLQSLIWAECNNPLIILALNPEKIPPNTFNDFHHLFGVVLLSPNGLSLRGYWDLPGTICGFDEIHRRGDVVGSGFCTVGESESMSDGVRLKGEAVFHQGICIATTLPLRSWGCVQ
jgi:hypothetical protein